MMFEDISNFELYSKSLQGSELESLKQMLRDALISEIDAVSLYSLQSVSISNPRVKKVLTDIRDEEIAHIGELYSLLSSLDPNIPDHIKSGVEEVHSLLKLGK